LLLQAYLVAEIERGTALVTFGLCFVASSTFVSLFQVDGHIFLLGDHRATQESIA